MDDLRENGHGGIIDEGVLLEDVHQRPQLWVFRIFDHVSKSRQRGGLPVHWHSPASFKGEVHCHRRVSVFEAVPVEAVSGLEGFQTVLALETLYVQVISL